MSQSSSSTNLQIRILLIITLTLMLVLVLSKVIQGATLGERLKAQADKLSSQQDRIDTLEQRVTGTIGPVGPVEGINSDGMSDLIQRIKDLENENRRLALANSGSGAEGTPSGRSGQLPSAIEGEDHPSRGGGRGLAGPVPTPGDGPTFGSQDLSYDPPPASPDEQQLHQIQKVLERQQPVGRLASISEDGSFVIIEPEAGIVLVPNDQVIVARETADGPDPIAILLIGRLDDSTGFYVADVLPEQRSELSGKVEQGDVIYLSS